MIELLSRSSAAFGWFKTALSLIHPDLRLVWGAENHGIELWVIERKLPQDVHKQCLEEFQALNPGQDRYIDQQLTDDHGQVIGSRRYDQVAEWVLGHVIQNLEYDVDDPKAYRDPAEYDLSQIRQWLFEYRNVEEQMREMRDAKAKREADLKKERIDVLSRDIVSSRSTWGDPEAWDIGRAPAMEGTEV